MNTRDIDQTLADAYDKAAFYASIEVRRHLRPFNLRRHPLSVGNAGLYIGTRLASEIMGHTPLVKALHEAGQFVDQLPVQVFQRLRYWL